MKRVFRQTISCLRALFSFKPGPRLVPSFRAPALFCDSCGAALKNHRPSICFVCGEINI